MSVSTVTGAWSVKDVPRTGSVCCAESLLYLCAYVDVEGLVRSAHTFQEEPHRLWEVRAPDGSSLMTLVCSTASQLSPKPVCTSLSAASHPPCLPRSIRDERFWKQAVPSASLPRPWCHAGHCALLPHAERGFNTTGVRYIWIFGAYLQLPPDKVQVRWDVAERLSSCVGREVSMIQ